MIMTERYGVHVVHYDGTALGNDQSFVKDLLETNLIVQWLDKNIQSGWKMGVKRKIRLKGRFLFRCPNDAILFKLSY